ncbi:hypothetical protein QBC35DRAFT_391742, partial [Podospora australis]
MRKHQSFDNGRLWHFRGVVTSGRREDGRDVDNAFPLQLPGTSRLLMAYRSHRCERNEITPTWNYTHYRIRIAYFDEGMWWAEHLSEVEEREANGDPTKLNGLWEPFLRVDGKGVLQAFYSSENSDVDQDNLMRFSKDGGKTWSDERIVVSGGEIVTR